ncbi:MAG: phosphatidate cytidylyltransferase [Oligoflexia bacterium]|nr:phosphatidate cytidylyltransferase [Oligoflexia bacterium]
MTIIEKLKAKPELRQRVVTGGVGAAALILLILFGGWIGMSLLTAVLSLGMVHEFARMSLKSQDQVEKRYLLLIMTWLVSVVNAFAARFEFELLILCFLVLFAYFLFTARGKAGEEFQQHFRELEFSVFGLVYLIFLPLFLPRIHESVNGTHWTLLFFLIVWAGDTLAYFVGVKYGRRPLYPVISPKKSVEGAFGGLGGGIAVALLYKLLFFRGLPWSGVLFVPLLVGAVAQVGDLCESFLKRTSGTKDSGSILPGHGGFLDRFDGVVFSLPVMYACTRIFG